MQSSINRGLLVIDVQEGFVSKDTEATAMKIQDLLDGEVFDSTVFSRFRNEPKSPHTVLLNWKKMTVPEEYEIWSPIRERAVDIIDKPSYTALTEEFRSRIAQEGVDTLFIAGLDTDCCVLKTAVDLFEEGVRPIVLADYCGSTGGTASHEAGLKVLGRLIGRQNVVKGLETVQAVRQFIEGFFH